MVPCIVEVGAIELLYIFCFMFWMIYLYFVKDYGYWEQRRVPHVPAVFPCGSLTQAVIGNTYKGTILDKIYKNFKEERFIGYIHVREPCMLIRDPELIKQITNDKFDHFVDRRWVEVNPKDYILRNLMCKTGKEWKELRDKLTPAFDNGVSLELMFCLLWKSSDLLYELVDKQMKEQNFIDVKDILSQFTTNVYATCAFGTDINSPSAEDTQFYKICEKAMNNDLKIKLKGFLYAAFPIVSKYHLFDMLNSDITSAAMRKIRSTLEFREASNTKKSDFLNLLIKMREYEYILNSSRSSSDDERHPKSREEEGLSMEEIISETFGFFTIGHETTSTTAQFCLYELACNEGIQEKVFQEVQEVFKKYDNDLKGGRILDEMSYLSQVINETLRRYPVFNVLHRKCTQNYKIPNSNVEIEKGLRLLIPLFSLHHDSKYFPEPYTFNPERFNAQNCQKRHPCTFLPFGIGPRKCIGYNFGLMTVKLAVARLVYNFHIKLTPETPISLHFMGKSFITKPSKPILLSFIRR